METNRRHALRRLVLVVDAVLVLFAMLLTAGLHERLRPVLPILKSPPEFREYAVVAYLSLPVVVAFLAYFGLDEVLERALSRRRLVLELLKVEAASLVVLALVLFATQATVNRSLVGLFLANTYLLLYFEKAALITWRRFQHETGQGRERLVLVGADGPALRAFVDAVNAAPLPAEVGTRLDDASSLERVLHDEAVDRVVFFPPHHDPLAMADALRHCEMLGIPASFHVDLARPAEAEPRLETLHERPFVTFDVAPKPPAALAVKHALDFVVAALLLLACAPIMLAAALGILVTMGRPIFFSQERAGLQGRKFRMLKFRTMVRDAEARRAELEAKNEMSGPVFKVTDDPRITPLGRFLRKYSIDELPQFVNVLLGTMSLVGPRPLPSAEQRQIRGWHRRRLSMKPGLTGVWQTSGRNDVDFEEWMALDLKYVDEWSLWRDLVLIAKTPLVVLRGRGAK